MKKIFNILIACSLMGLLYFLLGVIQAAMLAGAPSYSQVRAEYNELLWARLSGICFGLTILLVWLRLRIRKRERKSRLASKDIHAVF
jgi:hypothetical protein